MRQIDGDAQKSFFSLIHIKEEIIFALSIVKKMPLQEEQTLGEDLATCIINS